MSRHRVARHSFLVHQITKELLQSLVFVQRRGRRPGLDHPGQKPFHVPPLHVRGVLGGVAVVQHVRAHAGGDQELAQLVTGQELRELVHGQFVVVASRAWPVRRPQ
jgi:hypothetical protein